MRSWCLPFAAALAAASLLAVGPARAELEPGPAKDLLELQVVASGLNAPTDIALLPDGRALIVEKFGRIVLLAPDGTLDKSAGQLEVVVGDNEQGLLGVVAHPDFANNQTLFFYASVEQDIGNRHKVLRGALGGDGKVSIDRANPVVDKGLEGPRNHNGGGLVIHKGYLYFSVGDSGFNPEWTKPGSLAVPVNKYASCLNKANGSILRVALDGSVPADNPLVGESVVTGCERPDAKPGTPADLAFNKPFKDSTEPDTRIFAWGLRNAWRFWLDPQTDLIWAADVGEFQQEEISVGGKGSHFGFPFYEGTHQYPRRANWSVNDCSEMKPQRPCTPPVFAYTNRGERATKSGEDSAIIGGLIIDDERWPARFRGRYVFGDFESGSIWMLKVNQDRRGVDPSSFEQIAKIPYLAGFRMGPDGGLYVVGYGGNNILRLSPAPVKEEPPPVALAPAPLPDPESSPPWRSPVVIFAAVFLVGLIILRWAAARRL